jgi:hypothetical protein
LPRASRGSPSEALAGAKEKIIPPAASSSVRPWPGHFVSNNCRPSDRF